MMLSIDSFGNSLISIVNPSNKSICVAFSGGSDSVCLLSLLNSVKNTLGFSLFAIHVNHNLRGNESNRDCDFCVEFCKKLGVPLKTVSVDVKSARKKGESIEMAARRIRYEIFEDTEYDYIVLAHQADDALETFIINFTRGSGLKGLCGITPVRGRFIRPLLPFTKCDVFNFCRKNNLSYVTDSTNLTDDYTRNLIRHRLVPVLKHINPAVVEVSARNFYTLRQDSMLLENEALQIFNKAYVPSKGINIRELDTDKRPLIIRIIKNYFDKLFGITPDFIHLNECSKIIIAGSGRYQINKNLFAKVKNGYFFAENFVIKHCSAEYEVMPLKKFKNTLKINNLLLKNAIDYDKIIGKFKVRVRMPGDKMRLGGRNCTKELRRLQAEAGIPSELRADLPVAADENGVIWAAHVGVCERVLIDEKTKNVLIFSLKNND